MERQTMRKRGWSVHSEHTTGDTTVGSDDRSLSHEEKRLLLDSLPTSMTTALSHEDENDGDFSTGDVSTGDVPPTREVSQQPLKKQRLQTDENYDNDNNNNNQNDKPLQEDQDKEQKEQERMLELAKTKLSKWAARLFDPNRPRGLIEPPQTIPLNDEFLQAFGKREKEFDTKVGRTIDIDLSNLEDDDKNDNDDDTETLSKSKQKPKSKKEIEKEREGRKVKITNMAYRTTEETLQKVCELYGPLEEVNLIMDKEKPDMNAGRAYVTFETVESASKCISEMTKLDGRQLNITLAQVLDGSKGGGGAAGGGGGAGGITGSSGPARYWEKDISTKCFRCGKVGHMVSSCPNEAKLKPCPLCAGVDHEQWSCPFSRICFNCGVPGHVNRECPQQRGMPKRLVCGTCFQSGHHRVNCYRRSAILDVSTRDAKCMVCHQLGHFMCQDMKWFFGLEGVSCFNCGRNGHHGYDCERPGLDSCFRNQELTTKEIDMAEAESAMDELNQALGSSRDNNRGRGRERGREREDSNRDFQRNRNRARSQPPPREYGRGYDNERRGGGGGNRRTSPPPPPSRRGHSDDRRSSSSSTGGNYNSGRGQQRGYSNNNNNNRGYNGGGNQGGRRGYR